MSVRMFHIVVIVVLTAAAVTTWVLDYTAPSVLFAIAALVSVIQFYLARLEIKAIDDNNEGR